ncbi:MAG: carboxypeptidase regulatory-like domain-containing protein [Acidobacteria bacterium]|nr:carboxypeptidase regulatory-like domain-containing protein [Acidobacteriota bacterium]
MKKVSHWRIRVLGVLLASGLTAWGIGAAPAAGADYGRIAGAVSDQQGNPLMGASVTIAGPLLTGLQIVESGVQRVITDAGGRFAVERLTPGWYSLRVTSPTRLPAMRNRVRVDTGKTAWQNFVLSDILSSLRLEVPSGNVSSWGEDWKWVLRTAAATRPVLRYQEAQAKPRTQASKKTLPESKRLIAMMPGANRRDALAEDAGLGSVLAYLRPLSEDSDLLVAGSMGASGLLASSLATAFRTDLLKGDPQELALVIHQLSFSEGMQVPTGDGREALSRAQGVVLSYAHSRRLTESLTVTGGMEVDYLNAVQGVASVRPRVRLEYQVSPSSALVVHHGALEIQGDDTLVDRVGALNAFPRVTLKDYRAHLERLKHTEVSYGRRITRTSRVEVAAYRDDFENSAVWGVGRSSALSGLVGDFLPNPSDNGATFNAGDYSSSGLRAVYAQDIGGHVKAAFLYSFGDALVVESREFAGEISGQNLRAFLRPRRTQSVAGKVTALIPVCRTQVTTSYEWLPQGRVTGVDPYAQSSLQLQPYLGIQVRQPLPPLAFFPARIEALADFRNLLAQGYVPLSGSNEEALLMTPAYRSFRGGFSVLF